MNNFSEFLNKKNIIAVVGASQNKEKFGWKVYNTLKKQGYETFPINPKYDRIGNGKCYPSVSSLPKKIDVVITITPPKITELIVKECKKININKVWMQEGSESENAINFCKQNNIKVISKVCFVVDGLDIDLI